MLVTEEERNNRLAICSKCPFVIGTTVPICTQCGCLLLIKSRFAFFHCPLSKWENDEVKDDFIRYEHNCNSCGQK